MNIVKISNVTVLVAMISVIVGCDNSPVKPFVERSAEICDYVAEKPQKVKVYVDASGSMKGYFSLGSDGRFIGAISNANADEAVWMDQGLTPIRHPMNTEVLNAEYKRDDSRFHEMINRIAKDLKSDSCLSLGLFYTDGIISSSPTETKIDQNHTLKSKVELRNAIAKELENDSLAIAFLMLESRFDGTYVDYTNTNIPDLKVQDRPFYVMAIGKAPQVRYFVKHNNLGSKLYETFGLYDSLRTDTTANQLLSIDQKKWEFKLSLPPYINDLGESYIKKNFRVELNNQDVTGFVSSKQIDKQLILTLTTYSKDSTDAPTIKPKGNTFNLSNIKKDVEEFANLNCIDDSEIAKIDSIQKQTFMLSTLLEGIKMGTGEKGELVVFRASITFDKQK